MRCKKMIYFLILFIEVILLIAAVLMSLGQAGESMRSGPYPFKFKALAPASGLVVDRFKLMKRISTYAVKAHEKVVILYGNRGAREITRAFVAEMLSQAYVCLIVSTLLSLLADDFTPVCLGLLIAGIIPLLGLRRLNGQVEQRKRSIILELPEILNKIILLVNAGETVQRALLRALPESAEQASTPLRNELKLTIHELQMNVSFAKAMENMSRRCASQEISMFTTTLLLNHKRGGDELVLALRTLSKELWERRKAVSRTLGEEASSKLVFPMVVIFFVVMVIVGAPALMMMNQ